MTVEAHLKLRSQALSWREVDGEIVAVDQRTSVYLAGNRAAGVLWPLLAEGSTEAELTRSLMATFRLGQTQAAADVRGFVDALHAQGLVELEHF